MIQFPPPDVLRRRGAEIATFLRLVIRAAELSQAWNAIPSSWYQSQLDEQALRDARGSAVTGKSQHAIGTALDVVGDDAEALASMFVQLGGIAVNEGDHWHLQLYARGTWT